MEIEFTVKVKVQRRAMFFVFEGTTITEGEYKGTGYHPAVGSGMPILYVKRNGVSDVSSWMPMQELLKAWLAALAAITDEIPDAAVRAT